MEVISVFSDFLEACMDSSIIVQIISFSVQLKPAFYCMTIFVKIAAFSANGIPSCYRSSIAVQIITISIIFDPAFYCTSILVKITADTIDLMPSACYRFPITVIIAMSAPSHPAIPDFRFCTVVLFRMNCFR